MEINNKNERTISEIMKETAKIGKLEEMTFNGTPFGFISYSGEKDKQNAEKMLKVIIGNTDNMLELAHRCAIIAKFNALGVIPDEQICINEEEYFISYQYRKMYDAEAEEIVNMDDIGDVVLPNEAIKTILSDRIKARIADFDD